LQVALALEHDISGELHLIHRVRCQCLRQQRFGDQYGD
jgi:hypothetical protein